MIRKPGGTYFNGGVFFAKNGVNPAAYSVSGLNYCKVYAQLTQFVRYN
jgi:hypothetical protein